MGRATTEVSIFNLGDLYRSPRRHPDTHWTNSAGCDDWVVDLSGQKRIGNPAHGGEHVIEMY